MDTQNSKNKKPDGDQQSPSNAASLSDVEELSQQAIKLAKHSNDVEVMLKAIQLNSAIMELKDKKIVRKWSHAAQIIPPYTAVFAVILSILTLAWQYWEFRQTQQEQQENAEKTQWREALKNISIRDDSSVLSSSLQLQTFFGIPQYASQARTSAVALLPLLGDGSELDIVLEGMIGKTNADNQVDLIALDQIVAGEEFSLFGKLTGSKFLSNIDADRQFVRFLVDPEQVGLGLGNGGQIDQFGAQQFTSVATSPGVIDTSSSENEYSRDQERRPLKRAIACTWKLGSISNGLGYLWRGKGLTPRGKDLASVILVDTDLSGIDFSNTKLPGTLIHNCNLTKTKFEGAALDEAVFTQVKHFEDSRWDKANWWDAELLSCELANYLMTSYAPSDPEKKAIAQILIEQSCRKPH